MKKDLKKKTKSPENITYSDKEMKRYLGALNEQNGENLKAIKEGFQVVNRKLDLHTDILNRHEEKLDLHTEILSKHDKKLDMHTEMIGGLMEDVSVLKEDVSVLKEDVSVLKEDVSVIKEDVSILKDDMQIVKKELKKKVDYDEFLSLVQRVNKLEAKN
jgi:chromosome segregation ATPase